MDMEHNVSKRSEFFHASRCKIFHDTSTTCFNEEIIVSNKYLTVVSENRSNLKVTVNDTANFYFAFRVTVKRFYDYLQFPRNKIKSKCIPCAIRGTRDPAELNICSQPKCGSVTLSLNNHSQLEAGKIILANTIMFHVSLLSVFVPFLSRAQPIQLLKLLRAALTSPRFLRRSELLRAKG